MLQLCYDKNSRQALANHEPEACNFIKKETLAQVFSCEFREISEDWNFKLWLIWETEKNTTDYRLLVINKIITVSTYILLEHPPRNTGSSIYWVSDKILVEVCFLRIDVKHLLV